jgi:hypothetical protein
MTHVQIIESAAISNNKKQQQMLMFLLAPFSTIASFDQFADDMIVTCDMCRLNNNDTCANY